MVYEFFMSRMKKIAELFEPDYVKAFHLFETNKVHYELTTEISLQPDYFNLPGEFHDNALISSFFIAMLKGKQLIKVCHPCGLEFLWNFSQNTQTLVRLFVFPSQIFLRSHRKHGKVYSLPSDSENEDHRNKELANKTRKRRSLHDKHMLMICMILYR